MTNGTPVVAPSSTNRTFVGRALSALHRPTGRADMPIPSVTVAVVLQWVSIHIVRRRRATILRLCGHECATRDCAAANRQEHPRCTHSCRCLPLSWSRQHTVVAPTNVRTSLPAAILFLLKAAIAQEGSIRAFAQRH